MAGKKSSGKDERTRNWTFIIYPDSVPSNWKDIIDNEHIPWIESPLHEKDENADGEHKKPHWHILLLFDGKKSYEQIEELTKKLNATIPQKCANAKGLVRYMAHLDNPEKVQYSKSDIIGHGGADVTTYLKVTGSSRYQLIGEMRQWVEENHCTEFFMLFDYAADKKFDDWFPLLCDNSAYIMGEYIKSRRHYFEILNSSALRSSASLKVDYKTGEVKD
jgi:hypothetical protein